MTEVIMLRVLISFCIGFTVYGCAGDFLWNPEEYIYPIVTADYNLDYLSSDTDIVVQTYDLENGGSVNVSDNCDGTVVYMELDHGKSLGKIYCKQGWYPDETSDAQQ